MNIVEVENLTKIFSASGKSGAVKALDGVTLSVGEGTIFGLLGPNGAGKTTLVKILLGIVRPTSGNAKLLGEDVSHYKIKSRVGYLPENHKFPNFLTGEGVMKYFGELAGMKKSEIENRIDPLLSLVKMKKWKRTKIKSYSKGMMQRLGIAQALINNPDVIFLDEPTDGVDPIGRKEIRDILLKLKNEGKTIFLNSHLLSEIEMVCNSIAILNKGKLIREGTVEEITTTKEIYDFEIAEGSATDILAKFGTAYSLVAKGNAAFSGKFDDVDRLNSFIDSMRGAGVLIKSVVPKKVSLEDMFISVIEDSEGGKNE
ncbi:MAG: ABC transporter ATP-binding protein [Chlorobi bacterium]|nr:ABC transporter ATP-binding protein [Chlorobiota bacterium]